MPHRLAQSIRTLTPTLRLRLTLWVLLIFAVIQLTLGLVFMLYQRASINRLFDDRLRLHSNLVRADVAASLADMNDMQLRAIMRRRMGPTLHEDITLGVYNAQGDLLANSGSSPVVPPPGAVRRTLDDSRPRVVRFPLRLHDGDGARDEIMVRAKLIPIESHEGVPHVLLCAIDDSHASAMLGLSFQVLAVTLPIGLLSALVSGWFVAGIATAPLHELGRIARRLSPESIGRRVGLESNSPEVAALQAELENARQRIEKGFLAQARVMSNVSHELKTPIAVILTELQTLKPEGVPPEVGAFLRSVEEELKRLGRLIDSFLLLTRVREGKSSTRLERITVNDLVLDSASQCASMARQHNVTIDPCLLDQDDTLDAAVLGEPELLRTMLNNLVRNAIRFSPERGVVHIEPRVDNGSATITVRDHGTGIPCELIDHIFDRFAQAKSEVRRGRGHGLGLEIAQGIAELHGGLITVRNLDEGGCAFTIALPREGNDRGTPIDPSIEREPDPGRPFVGR